MKRYLLIYQRPALLLMVGALLIFGWRCWFLYQQAQDRYLKVSLQSSIAGQTQLYYDRGYGFNEHDSVVMHIAKGRQKLWGIFPLPANWSDSSYQHYLFQLTPPVIYALRFDPVSGSTMHIKNVEIVDGLEHHLRAIDLQQLQSVKQIKAFNISNQEVTLTAEEEGDPQINIMLDSPLMFDPAHPVLWAGFLGTILWQAVIIISLAVFILMIKKILPSDKLISSAQNLSWLLKHLMHGHVILIVITAIFLWFYGTLITRVFPLLFDKIFFCALLILIARYILTRDGKDKNINALIYVMVFYLLLIAISAVMHYYAINSSEFEHIDFTSGYFDGQAALFDKYKGIKKLTDNVKNSDQSAFMYFFPFLFLASIALFRSTAHGLKVFTWIPLLFIPHLLVVLYQYGEMKYVVDATAGIGSSIFLLRLLLFLIFPLSVLAGIIVKHWWKKVLYVLIMIVILWLAKLSYGRGAILGILIFIVMLPMIRLWVHGVHGFRSIALRNYVYVGLALIFSLALLAGFAFPKYHKVMSKIFTTRMVNTCNTLISGDLKGTGAVRADMIHTAWRLAKSAPVSGWGPSAFQKNANRIRFMSGEKDGGAHATNFTVSMAANFGFVGLGVVLVLHLMPLWMIIRVRKQIQNHEERWAVGIVFVTICIMLLISNTNPNFSLAEVNWIYSLYLGFLVSVALKYGYTPYPIKLWLWGIGALLLLIVFIAGTYSTTFGAHGYRAIQKDLISRITSGYHPGEQITIWDSKKKTGTFNVSNHLIKTRANPFREKYTTNLFKMQASSRSFSMQASSNLFCIRTSVGQQSNLGSLFKFRITLQVFLGDEAIGNPHVFQMEGEKLLYYYVPNIENNEVEIKVKVDMWRGMPYHEDYRTEVEQEYMPSHPDYRDFTVTISVIPFIKPLPATNNEKTASLSSPLNGTRKS